MDVHLFVTQIKEFCNTDDVGKTARLFQFGQVLTQHVHDKDGTLNKAMSNVSLATLENLLAGLSAPWAEATRYYLEGCYHNDKGDRTHAYVYYAKAFMAFEEKKSEWPLTHIALREVMEVAAEKVRDNPGVMDFASS
ncbi:hypothetical protein BGZ81_005229 [Podila clonocystis]|nr:hypothetical protein BGZ81_005229 [Podila clonocystis]